MTNISQEGGGTEELNWKPPYIKIGLKFQDWRLSPRKECGVWGGGCKNTAGLWSWRPYCSSGNVPSLMSRLSSLPVAL